MLTSGGLGTMGYGFPAALGAQMGNPDKRVFAICGDGGVQMNIQEFATAMHYRLPVTLIVLNNGFLVMYVNGNNYSTINDMLVQTYDG